MKKAIDATHELWKTGKVEIYGDVPFICKECKYEWSVNLDKTTRPFMCPNCKHWDIVEKEFLD